jgi:hypothetical protein
MVKSEIVVLIEKEKVNANVLLPRCYRRWWTRVREKSNVTCTKARYNHTNIRNSLIVSLWAH